MGATSCTAPGMGGDRKVANPLPSHPTTCTEVLHPTPWDQRVPGHKHSPMVQPLGPTSPFLGAAKEMKDPIFSSSPISNFCKREFPAGPLLLRWMRGT